MGEQLSFGFGEETAEEKVKRCETALQAAVDDYRAAVAVSDAAGKRLQAAQWALYCAQNSVLLRDQS